ncbi:MAG: LacI family transcriptional regulator [Ruminococcaceae bacterium]|nr:LacI family transcriptional regulator [Oscillospiraceae bacterium]
MDKRVTIKDIAKAAGVSVATVSYVLNNRQDQKISTATKARVLQAVSDMGYTGTRAAKSTAQRTGCIAICSGAEDGTLLQADHGSLISALVRQIEQRGYLSIILTPDRCDRITKADALICIDASDELIRRTVQHNSIPVLELNGWSDHPMTCRINTDYAQVMRRAQEEFGFDFCVVTCDPPSAALREHISAQCGSDVFFCRTSDDLIDFLAYNKGRPLAVCSATAYWICKAYGARAVCTAPETELLAENTAATARLCATGHQPDLRDIRLFLPESKK